METRKIYEQPQTEEIKLSMNTSLLAGSGQGGTGTPEQDAPGLREPEW